ncbi:hypothetical protein NCCP1664_24810 [Zafaria cholistanensis]|uniref:Resolvase/invertase-type recombinase catalytic domain-containing protein n=1 Tax=Zafaria cholistanensis TaxID=1682741 RepID=A0A5A7NTR0_9MICC|nr:recombinase family protein [Zafaria cholistanensis]GER23986.1 hypothetical protein NCCP1664_24810 [Zafaria cholistanensis]
MGKLIGYVRVSTRAQDADRQIKDLLAAGVRRDDLYVDHGGGGARASRPSFDRALNALEEGDALMVTTPDRLGRSTANMLGLTEQPVPGALTCACSIWAEATRAPVSHGSMVFTVMAASAQMELEIKRQSVTDSVTKRRASGGDLGGRRPAFTNSQIHDARRLIDAGQPATHVAPDLGMSRAALYRRMAELDARQRVVKQAWHPRTTGGGRKTTPHGPAAPPAMAGGTAGMRISYRGYRSPWGPERRSSAIFPCR